MRTSKKVAFLGVFTAVALILSYIESMLPTFVPVPGIKLGLANIVALFVLYRFSYREAALISLIRIVVSSMLFGFTMFPYSLAGAVLSLTGMILLKKLTKLSIITVSVAGGVLHNLGQIAVAVLVTETVGLVGYIPVLLISGTVSGVLIGVLGGLLYSKTPEFK
ncbi:MAG: Gx transporter family protein [Clostridia bacterium]|nr:Gx transporter family protein [Clostridia bacterium]